MKKLTLSADPEIIKQAKALARESGMSVSALFASFVRSLARRKKAAPKLGPLARQATGLIKNWPQGKSDRRIGRYAQMASGIMKLPAGKTDRELIEDALLERYGFK